MSTTDPNREGSPESPGLRRPSRPDFDAVSVSPPREPRPTGGERLGLRLVAPPSSMPPAESAAEEAWAASGPQARSDRIGRLEASTPGDDRTAYFVASGAGEAWGVCDGLLCELALGDEWVPGVAVAARATHDAPPWSLELDFPALAMVSLATRERTLALVNRVGGVSFNPDAPGVLLRLPIGRLLGSAFRVVGWREAAAGGGHVRRTLSGAYG